MSEIPDNLKFETELWGQGFSKIAGIDEVGRGPLAGPVVAAAVRFAPHFYLAGVTDSKKLTANKREVFYDEIFSRARGIGIGIVDQTEIDRINIRQATFAAMRKAIDTLEKNVDYLLIDGEALPAASFPQTGIVKGDLLSFTIAAASIVAKVTRDRMMREWHSEFPQYGFDRHKGYGTRLHIEKIREFGPCRLHRQTFLKKILG